MTRTEVLQLEWRDPFPKELHGRLKVFEEVFINPGGEATSDLAKKHLRDIQEEHPRRLGWEKGANGVFQDWNGEWYAFCHLAKYRP